MDDGPAVSQSLQDCPISKLLHKLLSLFLVLRHRRARQTSQLPAELLSEKLLQNQTFQATIPQQIEGVAPHRRLFQRVSTS